MSDNIIQLNTELVHNELKNLVRNSVEETLNAMLDAEADRLVNADRYSHTVVVAFGNLYPADSIADEKSAVDRLACFAA